MRPKYIIVQAGGKGTRLGHLTANKPKALVPIGNLPMMFHLFRQFPEACYVIIADYKADVMKRYLAAFAKVKYLVVDAHGASGTCAGIRTAMGKIPQTEPFMLIWSDLVLPNSFSLPEEPGNYIGLSKGFRCRWKYDDGHFSQTPSEDAGVAGLFVFENPRVLQHVPDEGEFVHWLQLQEHLWQFGTISLEKTKEYGLLCAVERLQDQEMTYCCRPFNSIRPYGCGDWLIKEGIDEQGKALAVREKAWYRFVQTRGFQNIPKIERFEPFIMERINGKNVFDYELTHDQKEVVLGRIVKCLKQLHALEETQADQFSIHHAYLKKTWDRLNKVRDLIPFADQRIIRINGKDCRNIFFIKEDVENLFAHYSCEHFVLIHGDCTFSNMLLNEAMEPILIDPRGYFGYTELYGDVAYDWAKLYYSIVGNYDQFNKKRFRLDVEEIGVTLKIESNGWEDMEERFFEILSDEVDCYAIRLIHAMIWLSLTTYAWEDYDSICGAFYNGLLYLEDLLRDMQGAYVS